MALLDELQRVQEQGFNDTCAAHQRGEVPLGNPYASGLRAAPDRAHAWKTGAEKAERFIENRAYAEKAKRDREERRQTITEKLEEVFGGYDEREAFEEWLAAFVDARTR